MKIFTDYLGNNELTQTFSNILVVKKNSGKGPLSSLFFDT